MKNLKLISEQSYNLDTCDFLKVDNICTDDSNVYICCGMLIYKLYPIDETCSEYNIETVASLENVTFVDVQKENNVVNFSYLCEKKELILCMLNGDIICVPECGTEVEVVGCVESGIKSSAWSPEQEFLIIVTGNGTVMSMNNEFDPLVEVLLHSEQFGEGAFVNVGWGKKETQFHGSEGKAAAKVKQTIVNNNLSYDDNCTRISWRNDSEYFAVSVPKPQGTGRYIRIFNKDCVLQATSEDLLGLESAFHWYSSKIMASTQRLPNKQVVCFIEKNGLKHGEFSLPYNNANVTKLLWNEDSKILLVVCNEVTEDMSETKRVVHLFTINNYHWYCKFTLDINKYEELMYVEWDKKQNHKLHMVLKQNNVLIYKKLLWSWFVNKSSAWNSEDETLSAVIDGNKLNLTSFSKGIIPPPMSSYVITAPLPINNVIFPSDLFDVGDVDDVSHCNDVMLFLADQSVLFFHYKICNVSPFFTYTQGSHVNININSYNTLNHFLWIAPNKILCLLSEPLSLKCQSNIIMIVLDNKTKPQSLNIKQLIKTSCHVQSISKFKTNNDLFILGMDGIGQRMKLVVDDDKCDIKSSQVTFQGDKNKIHETEIKLLGSEEFVIILDATNKLFVNNQILAKNISSFLLHNEFLLMTTFENNLLCLNLFDYAGKKLKFDEVVNIASRKVERGSRLISSVNNDNKVILQMPRGNLECIQPRQLSLSVVNKHLDCQKYYEAFNKMRKERINLNLIVDYDRTLFLSSLSKFVEQIKNQSWLCLFLSELSDEDVTKTMYKSFYLSRSKFENNLEENLTKTKLICDEMLKQLLSENNSDEYLLPILTCYLKKGKIEDIEAALLIIKQVKDRELAGEKVITSSESALKHVLYTIDVEELYRTALGMYDFDLVLLVANKSQKDPKEFIPFLNSLRKLEPCYQKFTIDKYLKRYQKALKHALSDENETVGLTNETLQFIRTHNLYQTALSYTNVQSKNYRSIAAEYGEQLLVKRIYNEAAVMFERAEDYQKALQAYVEGNSWKEAIRCSRKSGLDEGKLRNFYRDLVQRLKDMKRYEEASIILLEYLNDVELAIATLCSGRRWSEALRLVDKHLNNPILNNHLKSGIVEHFNAMVDQINQLLSVIKLQKDRLVTVRENKLLNDTSDCDGMNDESDLYSETSTVKTASFTGSRSSSRTYRSSKNKRKHERKVLSLKEGSPFEDLALVAALHQHISSYYNILEEVQQLVWSLIQINSDSNAKTLQDNYDKGMKMIDNFIPVIWTCDLLDDKGFGPEATSNKIAESYQKNVTSTITANLDIYLRIPPRKIHSRKWQYEILNS